MKKSNLPKIFFYCFLAAWLILAIKPYYRFDWFLENLLIFIFVPFLINIYYRKNALSDLSWALLFIFFLLHIVGAHYTYSEVPFSAEFSSWVGWQRNHYDRFVHFLFGLLLTIPVFEFTSKKISARNPFKYFTAFCIVATFGSIYELLEWGTVLVVAPEAGSAYLGTQGDIWDAQKDLLLQLGGSLLSLTIFSLLKPFQKNTN